MLSDLFRGYMGLFGAGWQPPGEWRKENERTHINFVENTDMIVIEGTVRVDPEKILVARPAMLKMITASRAEAGCIDYAYAEDLVEPGLIRVAERWQSRADLKAHFQTEHMAEWRGEIAKLGIRDRQLRLYEAEPEEI